MKRAGKWALGAALTAAAALATLQTVSAPPPDSTTPTATASKSAAPVESPPTEQPPCAYQWAHQSLPELSAELDAEIKSLNSAAEAYAQAFGENCVSTDGSSTFGAMETDFYIRLPVDDLTQEEEFGNWMAQALEFVTQIPREKLQGPNYGFAEFTFEKSEAERIVVRVSIRQYLDTAQGKSGVELFQMFYASP